MALGGIVWLGLRGDLNRQLFLSFDTWWRDGLLGLAAAGILLGLWALGRRFLVAARRIEDHVTDLIGGIQRDEIFALAVISSVAEEIFFRGAVQGSWGWMWATSLFAVLHTGPGRHFRLWTLFALVAGLVFAGLTQYTGNLLAAVIAHGVVNGVNLRYIAQRNVSRGSAQPRTEE